MKLVEYGEKIVEFLEILKNSVINGNALDLIKLIFILIPLIAIVEKSLKKVKRRIFIRQKICVKLSTIESAEVYYSIDKYIPTRFSANKDSGDDDEPNSNYENVGKKKELALIDYLIKEEFDIKNGVRYYLCLADCGMGKTTFLINLYYQLVKKKKSVEFISLQDVDCLEKIDKINKKGRTILLLDALDENQDACVGYDKFIETLQKKTLEFQRVVITSRTNFFESEEKEHLSENIRVNGISSKFVNVKKFYITPFTDEDIHLFLRKKYPYKKSKQRKAWKLIEDNRNLSVRPLLLRFMDEVLEDGESFEYDFELYESLFRKWINREKNSMSEESGRQLYEECEELAKAIYYQWMKNGKIGIYSNELTNSKLGISLKKRQLKGHAILNRTKDGMYKFSHKSYWEFLLAKLAFSDLQFAMDLNIRNFERAENFFLEMIKAREEKTKTETGYIGNALYLMKYGNSDDAERVCHVSSIMNSEDELIALSAIIIKSECLYRQHQYKKAKEMLQDGKRLIKKISLELNTLFIYAEFGKVLSQISQKLRLKSGQIFLEEVIEYCGINGIRNYSVLKCYCAYCNCCLNSFFKEKKIAEMNQLIEESFAEDQYANYLRDKAKLVPMKYGLTSYEILEKITRYNMRYMDLYEQIIYLSDYQISSINTKIACEENEIGSMIEKYFDGVWELHSLIYYRNSRRHSYEYGYGYGYGYHYRRKQEQKNCFYKIDIYEKIIMAYEVTNNKALNKKTQYYIELLIEYMKRFRAYEQMYFVLIEIFGGIGRSSMWNYDERQYALKKLLDVIQKYEPKFEVDVYWDFYILYSEWTGKKEVAQAALRVAYNLTQKDEVFRMTEKYCILLCAVLDYYEKPIYKNRIASKLLNITPEIYGESIDRVSVYYALRRYYIEHNNKHEIDINEEILRCEFNCKEIEIYYESCKNLKQEKLFCQRITDICLNKKQLTNDQYLELRKFVKNNKTKMSITILGKLEELIMKCEEQL